MDPLASPLPLVFNFFKFVINPSGIMMQFDRSGRTTLRPTPVGHVPKVLNHGSPQFGLKYSEMSPEATLVEFISTSAAYHGVKRQSIKDLEFDILKVSKSWFCLSLPFLLLHVVLSLLQLFPNNIMPANAAAWYMAKRRFYTENQLLLMLLRNYPKKFALDLRRNEVEFLETYNKEVSF